MQLWLLVEAVRALGRNKLRSVLTTIGIAIGVAAVVLVVAVGNAGSERALAELAALGDNLVWIEAGGRNVNGVRTGSHGTTSLTLDDMNAIAREVKRIKQCSPNVDGGAQVIASTGNWNTRWRGDAPSYLSIKRWTVAKGVAFSDDDVEHLASKILIGETVRQRLFGNGANRGTVGPGVVEGGDDVVDDSGVGRDVRIAGHIFTVVGLLAPKGQAGDGRDQDDWILLPYTTAMRTLRSHGTPDFLDDIVCSATSGDEVNHTIDDVMALMRQRHHIEPGGDDDFNIRRPDEVLKAQVQASNTLALLLIAVAAISLVVGGIGIMNVMLVSVAQRTKEIGLRMAVGATEGAIQVQFLAESVALSLCGGLFGVVVSLVASFAFEKIVEWPVTISSGGLGLALASSIGVGVVFGFYPAWRASKLEPIDALRHE